ncbi:MAG: hypothetical protein RBR71_12190 [Gudongella sp.]|nr:hypothetical protein [Gudongella sp.]
MINDFVLVNREVVLKTKNTIINNWQILLIGFVYTVIGILAYVLMGILLSGPIGILGGIVTAIVESAIISSYLFVLQNVLSYGRFRIRDIKNGFTYYLWKIYGVIFLIFIFNLILSFLSNIIGSGIIWLRLVIYIGALIFLNPLPETIYLKSLDSWESVQYSLEFIKENWFNWLIPNFVFAVLLLSLSFESFGLNMFLFQMRGGVLNYSLTAILISVIMIYRGHLYKILMGSTARKRQFMRKF